MIKYRIMEMVTTGLDHTQNPIKKQRKPSKPEGWWNCEWMLKFQLQEMRKFGSIEHVVLT